VKKSEFMTLNLRILLALEFFTLCLLIPGLIIGFRYGGYMFAFLWAATLYAFWVMVKTRTRPWREIWGWGQVRWEHLKPILIRWAVASVFMLGFLFWYNPDQLFSLARRQPEFLPVLFLLYPLISALPQEFLFCSFFFHRYKPFFGDGVRMVMASAVVFAFAHILYINPVAPVLSLAGGLIFAHTYRKTQSLALVTIEHGLYGNVLFLIGLGIYFYSGNVPAG